MTICFNINELALEGLGPTLVSMIRHASDSSQLELVFLSSGLAGIHRNRIQHLLEQESFNGSFRFIDFDAQTEFGHLKSLQGDYTPYGRLLIPRLMPDDFVLYLDADLIITIDILKLNRIGQQLGESIVGAVHGCNMDASLEHSFWIKELNYKSTTPYFNTGVLLMNLAEWRKKNLDARIISFANDYASRLLSADQTILNGVLKGDFYPIPECFNNPWYPQSPAPQYKGPAIFHFVGSPKPWDIGANLIHPGFKLWEQYYPPFWKRLYGKWDKGKLKRAWNIRRSYFRTISCRIRPR